MDRAALALRFEAQLLGDRRARSAEDVVGHLLAVQAQDARGARLAVRARATGLAAADVDRALAVDRSLVVGWLNRGTLHLVRAEDYWWLHALTTPQLTTGTMRRLREEGLDGATVERGLTALVRALEADGPLTRADLGHRLGAARVPAAGQAVVHLLVLATVRALVVRGPLVRTEQAFVLARDWLDPPPRIDREAALEEVARRYLAGHGPANEADLARWAGIGVRDARAGLAAALGGTPVSTGDLVDLPGRPAVDPTRPPAPRLLGAFDPVLLGWRSRVEILGDHERDVVSGGVFRAFAFAEGRAVGLWRLAGGRVVVSPFAPLTGEVAGALDQDGDDVVAFLTGEPAVASPSSRGRAGARLAHGGSRRMGPSGPGRP